MKGIVSKLKHLTHKTSDFLSKHSITLYSSLFLIVMFSCVWVDQKASYVKKLNQIQNEKYLLSLQLDEQHAFLMEQIEFTKKQSETIQKYENALQYAKNALDQQNKLIADLVNYLKKINHWPPKDPRPIPEQPDRSWAIHKR